MGEAGAHRTLARNRRAFHEYHVDERLEVGIILTGTEVKSMRAGNLSFSDAYARIREDRLVLIGLHISEYKQGNIFNHDPTRERTLLCHAEELARLRRKVVEKGLTLIPLEFYLKQGLIKVELGICRGKKLHDKRETIKRRDQQLDVDRETRGRR